MILLGSHIAHKEVISCLFPCRAIYAKAYERWTKEEDEKLISGFKEGKSIEEISVRFGRKYEAVRSRLRKLGLIE